MYKTQLELKRTKHQQIEHNLHQNGTAKLN